MILFKYYNYILYALIILAVFYIFMDSIIYLFKEMCWHIKTTTRKKKNSRIYEHLVQVFSLVSKGDNVQKNVNRFLLISFSIFVLFSFLLLKQHYGVFAIFASAAFAFLPYVYLRSKLSTVRLTGSHEGAAVIAEFVNQYKYNSRNVIAAIDGCVVALTKSEPIAKKAFYRMSMRLKTAKDSEEVQRILNDFVFATNTEWAKTLAQNIYNAVEEKVDILDGIEDLLRECKKINENIEKAKRANLEAMAMIKFAGPGFFLMFAYMAKSSSNLPWNTVINYEFNTPTGLLLFIVTVAIMFFNAIVVNLITKQKYDI